MKKIDYKDIMTVPNLISVLRLLLIIPIVSSYLWGDFRTCVILVALSGISDVADGFIARSFNQVSTFGKIIDPIADKLTQAVFVVLLVTRHYLIAPIIIAFVIKEGFMLIGAFILFKKGLRPSESKWWGKLSTVLLYVVCGIVILSDFIGFVIPAFVMIILVCITSVALLYSLARYIVIFVAIKKGTYILEEEKYIEK